MTIAVSMPRMGESVVEGTVERWLVAEGERVEKDQILCEVTTDKVDAEVPAPEAGVVTRILVSEGTTVKVGEELIQLDPQGQPSGVAKSAPKTATASSSASASASASVEVKATDQRVSPMARKLAAEQGVALGDLTGSGPSGRVTKADVLAATSSSGSVASATTAAPRAAAAVAAPAPGTLGEFLYQMKIPKAPIREGDKEIPFSAIRRRVAEHMVVSKIVSPHVGTVAELDLHKLVALRNKHKSSFASAHGFGLTFLPFIIAATVRGLKQFPRMNATVGDQTIIERAGIHVGVAVETDRGLVVPVIRNAANLSLVGLAAAIEDLARRARDRELTADDMAGGTFTVSNPGRQGNLYGFAVINQPQVGILRMGEIRKRPVVVEQGGEDTIAIRPMMHLALSYDHRIIDGVTGNSFLYTVAKELEAAEFEI